MKRRILLSCSILLVFLAGPGGGLSQPPEIPKVTPPLLTAPSTPPLETPPSRATEPTKKDDLVSELIRVLNETQAVDTFFVTLGLLDSMGSKAQPAVPVILRNAERLGVLRNHMRNKDNNGEQIDTVIKTLEKILGAEQETPVPRGDKRAAGKTLGELLGAATGAVIGNLKEKTRDK